MGEESAFLRGFIFKPSGLCDLQLPSCAEASPCVTGLRFPLLKALEHSPGSERPGQAQAHEGDPRGPGAEAVPALLL